MVHYRVLVEEGHFCDAHIARLERREREGYHYDED